jgi:hypothetical protein
MQDPRSPARSGGCGWTLLSVVLLFGGCTAMMTDAKNGEKAPRPTTAAEFAAAKTLNDLPSPYVTFQADKHIVTGVTARENITRRTKINAYYDLVKVGDFYAVVRYEEARGGVPGGRVTALAVPHSGGAGESEAFKRKPDAYFLPYTFDTTLKASPDITPVGGIGLLVMLAGAVLLFRIVYCNKSEPGRGGYFSEPEPEGWRWSSR